jgi:hypothetical protein
VRLAMTPYQIVLVQPEKFVFTEAFREVIECLQFAFNALAIPCTFATNAINIDATPIVFGAHHLSPDIARQLPPQSIIYNLEQLRPGYPWFSEPYLRTLGGFRVWDSHQQNIAVLEQHGIHHAVHVPIGYMPQMTRIALQPEDVDILFYGVFTHHRSQVLKALAREGMHLTALNGVFGKQRDEWIARAKLVLNLRQRPGGFFETPRVAYLLANKKAVVSEIDSTQTAECDFADGIAAAPAGDIPALCRSLLADADARQRLAERGFAAISATQFCMTDVLERALSNEAWPDKALSA